MFGLKSVYFYLIAYQITLIKFLKKLYFLSKNYNKSLNTKTPQQVYYNPNPFLLSIITSYHDQSFKINDVDPNIFWLEDKKKDAERLHNFFWLNLIDRKTDHTKLKKIIYIWMLKNSNYEKNTWETSTLSARIISWILNIDIILKNSTFDFRKNFLESIISQVNHLKKNYNSEKDHVKKIEMISAILLSGLVFKDYKENFEFGAKEINKIIENFFDNNGFPLTRNTEDLLRFIKFFIIMKECIKDAQKAPVSSLDSILEKNLICLSFCITPTNRLPLFNGCTDTDVNEFLNYLSCKL